ncbi:ComEC/Rec2 family competence protein [Tropicibacter oceani]|uniref:ComEC/Rec2 family competence protein n=1 Tax=Tropicibacter oceani TaxID=3058420 RepID=A0ABY8QH63_9RHOB|nr:ComEC/Rec2 family competence protein [Tropicibacter oceani]WGW03147.1 ComEC/Rec2 family competence protein [Tropicibacter oceani]
MARFFLWPQSVILAQRGFLFPWTAVFLAIGIGGYFALRVEPPVALLWLMLGLGGLGLIAALRAGAVLGPVLIALALIACGYGSAGLRAHWTAGPVLDFRYYGPIEGRIVAIDRSGSDAVRLTLDRVVLERMAPERTPARVRVSLHGDQGFFQPSPGATIILTGHLSAPGGAVEPGGFDFKRHAWFLRLGGIGYTRNPVLLLEPPGPGQAIFKARIWLSNRVQAGLKGEAGAFAAAVMTGDRSSMGRDTLQALRDTNLAHLLAISGLHMGLLAGFVFAVLRFGLLLHPVPRHAWPVKKLAALGALVAAFGYLLLSGGNVATERAFIMAATALCALILDRRAISLRAVAMAALIVLVLHPQALVSPGFQMSFAATTALVAVFEQVTRSKSGRSWPRWTAPVLSLVLSSAVAGLATAPVGMAHFNQASSYGLIANLVSVPVMGLLVVPMGVLAVLLMPFGLEHLALAIMGLGLDWILFVADRIAGWSGAVRPVVAPAPHVLPILALGGLILCLWQGRGRLAGLAPMALAIALWTQSERPALLIADSGTLVGVMTDQGRALSRAKGSGFIADTWLENDGFGGTQASAAGLWPQIHDRVARAQIGPIEVVHLQGKVAARSFDRCSADQIVIASAEVAPRGPCRVFDPDRLKQTGSVALWLRDTGLDMKTATQVSGRRLWHGEGPAPKRLAQKGQ